MRKLVNWLINLLQQAEPLVELKKHTKTTTSTNYKNCNNTVNITIHIHYNTQQ